MLTLAAFVALIFLFLRTDLSVLLVAENSHADKPWLYKFAGTWGNHEGSMLLWVTVLAIAGAVVALFERHLDERSLSATLAAQAALALGFFAFLLFASNPFARLNPAPLEGRGLNPLLQDPGLAFHPPTLYLGYVGLSVAFSLAVGALVTRQVGPALARAMQPWVLGGVGAAHARHHRRQLLGLLRAWLGRVVVLGPGRECLADAVARRDRLAPQPQRARRARRPARVDDDARAGRFLDVDGRDLPRPLGHPDLGPRLCRRSDARQLHPRAADALHRRRADLVRAAHRRT